MTVHHAKGTVFERETVTPGTYAAIGQIVNIGGPSMSRDVLDATDHDSPGQWRAYISGLRDAGEVTLEILFDPDLQGHIDLRSDLATLNTPKNYRIKFPDPTPAVWTFAGYVTRFEPRAPHDEKLVASVSIKFSGAPTFA